MQLKALLCLASTALAGPLLTRSLYNIDGKKLPDPKWDLDAEGYVIPPPDFPNYDIVPDFQCQAHENYVQDVQLELWKKECAPKIYQWKVDHNMFPSRQEAKVAKFREAEKKKKKAQEQAQKPAEPAQPSPLSKRDGKNGQLYNMDGEPIPPPNWEKDSRGRVKLPADWPTYPGEDNHECEPHKNYVSRLGKNRWRDECMDQIRAWKVTHNIFTSHEEAAAAKGNLENGRRLRVSQCTYGSLSKLPQAWKDMFCKRTLEEDRKRKEEKARKDAEKEKKQKQDGEGGH